MAIKVDKIPFTIRWEGGGTDSTLISFLFFVYLNGHDDIWPKYQILKTLSTLKHST